MYILLFYFVEYLRTLGTTEKSGGGRWENCNHSHYVYDTRFHDPKNMIWLEKRESRVMIGRDDKRYDISRVRNIIIIIIIIIIISRKLLV